MSGIGLNLFRRAKPDEADAMETIDSQPAAQRPTAPSDVPDKVQDAYGQAMFLVDRSPRASGALSRYCLQQIIRDFWDIPEKDQGTLSEELDIIADMIAEETRDSITCVREFGTIDFHFSQDRDLMVDTTVEEARMLLALVQLLFQEWYAERYKRRARCETIRRIAAIASNTHEEAPQDEASSEPDLPEAPDNDDNPVEAAEQDEEPDEQSEKPKLKAVGAAAS